MAARRALGSGRTRLAVKAALAPILFVMALALALACLPGPALAYDNLSAHPKINQEAVLRYLERAKEDEWLGNTSLGGRRALGLAVVENGMLAIREELQEMTVADWLAHGGLSADEPELPASFRHFYDPLRRSQVHYLTDHIDDLLEFGAGLGQMVVSGAGWLVTLPDTTNPQVDARLWALDHPDNRFTYAKAIEYYRAALGTSRPLSGGQTGQPTGNVSEYGKTWRAVGETMHLMADMTVPAHVRNDSHPYIPALNLKLGNPDPYESTIRGPEVAANADYEPARSINYATDNLYELFDAVARWTNRNFYSIDTIPIDGRATTHNGQPVYSAPVVTEELVTPGGTYFMGIVEGVDVPLVRRSMLVSLGMIKQTSLSMLKDMLSPLQVYVMDLPVLETQRSYLIPTAIEAASRVLEAFLPRLRTEFAAEPAGEGTFVVRGSLQHRPTRAWPDAPLVVNGAYLEFVAAGSDTVEVIWLPESAYLPGNRIEHQIEAKPGALVSLNWDLGGYVIKRDRIVMGGVDLDVLPERFGDITDGEETYFEAVLGKIPETMAQIGLEWHFGDETAPVTVTLPAAAGRARREIAHVYEQPGEYTLRVRATNPATGGMLAEVTRTVKVRQQQISVQIYPRGLTGRPGATLEASALPSNARYRYEWSFGDGQTVRGVESVVRHAWVKEGTFDLTVRLYRASDGAGATPLAQDAIKVEITSKAPTECEICGYIHAPATLNATDRIDKYLDSKGVLQCLYKEYTDSSRSVLGFSGVYVDGAKEGIWNYYWSGVLYREDPYRNGVMHGLRRTYDKKSGNLIQEQEYVAGNVHGIEVHYWNHTAPEYAGRRTKSVEYTMVYDQTAGRSVQHGPYTAWWEDGSIRDQGQMANGEKEGLWRHYTFKGVLQAEGHYHLGRKTGEWTEWMYGGTYNRGSYVDGAAKGTWTEYTADGKVIRTWTYP
jgi:antitoxin component YwqK of YwqJK toxin-antitoxin module